MEIESRLAKLGLTLPGPIITPPGVRLPFSFVRVRGHRALVSGHGPQNPDGSLAGPLGKFGQPVIGRCTASYAEQNQSLQHRAHPGGDVGNHEILSKS